MRVKEAPKTFHFLGICGTAMGAVAVALQERGFKVTGSDDNVYPPMSTFLAEKGIALIKGYRAENIPTNAEVVVIGNAMKRGNSEVEAVLNRKLLYLSLPEALRNFFLRGRHNLVIGNISVKRKHESRCQTQLARDVHGASPHLKITVVSPPSRFANANPNRSSNQLD